MRLWTEKHAMQNCHQWDENKALPREIFLKAAEAGILQGLGLFDF